MPSILALLHWGRAFLDELEDNQLAGDPKVSVMLAASSLCSSSEHASVIHLRAGAGNGCISERRKRFD